MNRSSDFRQVAACSCFAVRRAARRITQHYDRQLRPSGLRATQFTTLAVLALAGPLPLTALAERLATERTTLTRNLRLLLERGLVAEQVSGDRRVRVIALTEQGAKAAEAALPYWRKAQNTLTRALGAPAIEGLQLAAQGAMQMSTGRGSDSRGRTEEG